MYCLPVWIAEQSIDAQSGGDPTVDAVVANTGTITGARDASFHKFGGNLTNTGIYSQVEQLFIELTCANTGTITGTGDTVVFRADQLVGTETSAPSSWNRAGI